MKHLWMTKTQAAKHYGVHLQTVIQWIAFGKIDYWEPAEGVCLINKKTPRPKQFKPWGKIKKGEING